VTRPGGAGRRRNELTEITFHISRLREGGRAVETRNAMRDEVDVIRSEPMDWVEARSSGIHGMGLYAIKPIPSGTRVIEYLGERIAKSESLRRCEEGNPFIFSLDEEFDLDGSIEANLARFINHSCAPNCETEDHDGRIWVVALRDIEAGEEMTYNYNYDLEDYPDNPCRCGAPNCLGFMVAEELFPVVRERLKNARLASLAIDRHCGGN
jgi:uncharacterized protein